MHGRIILFLKWLWDSNPLHRQCQPSTQQHKLLFLPGSTSRDQLWGQQKSEQPLIAHEQTSVKMQKANSLTHPPKDWWAPQKPHQPFRVTWKSLTNGLRFSISFSSAMPQPAQSTWKPFRGHPHIPEQGKEPITAPSPAAPSWKWRLQQSFTFCTDVTQTGPSAAPALLFHLEPFKREAKPLPAPLHPFVMEMEQFGISVLH